MKISILTAAIDDLKKGRRFYEAQDEHLGEYFFDTLFSDIESLKLYAGIQTQIFGYYQLLSKRFPYAIYYKLDLNESIVVYRILDCRQKPNHVKKQLV